MAVYVTVAATMVMVLSSQKDEVSPKGNLIAASLQVSQCVASDTNTTMCLAQNNEIQQPQAG